jgi:hypothetical protein
LALWEQDARQLLTASNEGMPGPEEGLEKEGTHNLMKLSVRRTRGAVAGVVGIESGVVSGVFNLESSGVEAPDRRPRHDKRYHEA